MSGLIEPRADSLVLPKVTVCIPVYNGGKYLRLAISSVLAQSFSDFELIIVDDCSTESTEIIVSEFSDARLRFYRNSQNLGLVGNWNHCLELAQGEYIAIFHQDDVMMPNNLMRQVALLEKSSTIGFSYSDIKRINSTGKVIGGHWLTELSQPETDTILLGEVIFEKIAAFGNVIPCPTVIVRKECYERLGIFNATLPFATDLEMWMRIASQYDIGYVADALVAQRVHPDQETAKFSNTGKDYLDVFHALNIVFSRKLPPTHLRYARTAYRTLMSQAVSMAKWKLKQGHITSGLHYMSVASKSLLKSYMVLQAA